MKFNIGLIGTGSAAKTHIATHKSMPNTTVKWVLSKSKARAKNFAEAYCIPNYTNRYEDILKDSDVVFVDICNVPSDHLNTAVAALKAKKGVILEKPIGINYSEAKRFYNSYKDKPFPILVVYQYPYSQTFSCLKRLLQSKKFGKIKNYSVQYFSQRDKSYYQSWQSKVDISGGGVLINQGIHFINLLQDIIPTKACRIDAVKWNILHKMDSEDTIKLHMNHCNGVLGDYTFSTGLPSVLLMEFMCEKALIQTSGGKIIIHGKNQKVIKTPRKGTLSMLLKDFYSKYEKMSGIKMNFGESIRDLKIVQNTYRSAKTNKPVSFTL